MRKTDSGKSFWNRFSKIYDFISKKDQKAYDIIVDKIRNELNTNMNVLELATGTGLLAIRIADICGHCEATDFSEEMIAVAQKKKSIETLTFAVQDATNLTYKSKSFDVVIISNALHIMPEPKKALENIARVLKDDGILIAPTFTRNGKFHERIIESIMYMAGFRTFSKWKYAEYIQFLELNGWNIIKGESIKASFPIAFVIARKCRK
jgi:phosphatidylethanolamine/phosphatidyl-N-methylethanolamine N-methyltransferase